MWLDRTVTCGFYLCVFILINRTERLLKILLLDYLSLQSITTFQFLQQIT